MGEEEAVGPLSLSLCSALCLGTFLQETGVSLVYSNRAQLFLLSRELFSTKTNSG